MPTMNNDDDYDDGGAGGGGGDGEHYDDVYNQNWHIWGQRESDVCSSE